ncbi:unnamed protein product [Fusarium graminearum]|nr:unnamed protein product [Fusarium graminearum]CAG1964629.1 unnamed protein product [Fusarium graminearum]
MTLLSLRELLAQLSIIPIPSNRILLSIQYRIPYIIIYFTRLSDSSFTLATAAAPLTGSGASDVNTNANTSAASSLSKHSSCADTSGNVDISEYPLAKSSPSSLNSKERRAYEKARKNFNQQWKRVKDKLHARADFKNADSATKKSLEEAAFDEHSEKYKLLGRHPDQLLPDESSQSQSQVNQVDEDDGNSDWETDDELDEDEQEELDRICESLNYGESTEQMKVKSQDEIAARRVMGDFSVTTKYVRKTLKEALESLWTKCHYLRNRAKCPAHVFTRLEMFVWYMTKPEKLKTLKPLNRFWRLKNGYFKLPQGSKITYPLVKKRRNLNGIQSCRLFGAWPWWHVRQRVYLNGAPSVTQMLRDVHYWKLYSYKSPIWHYLPGPSFLWDDARIKQLRLFETALQHFDGPIMDTFRLLVGDFKPAELVNKREPWLELQVLNLFE